MKPGNLYIVGTPIGNLEDMTFRAIRILQTVDIIAAEDTRHTGKLLQHFQINTPQISYHTHNQQSRIPELVNKLLAGKAIALVTDAGMPGISDPGYELVQACIAANITVIPIPGPSAVITALSAAGLPTDRFVFEGFLAAKGQERQQRLAALSTENRTLIFYEAPHRLRQTLQDFAIAFGGDREIVLARELTKIHEEFWRGIIADAIQYYATHEPQGEFTVIIKGAETTQVVLSVDNIKIELQKLLQQGMSRSQASRYLAAEISRSRREIYQLALTIPDTAILPPE